jgi:hypothetical protein
MSAKGNRERERKTEERKEIRSAKGTGSMKVPVQENEERGSMNAEAKN